ncbi:hypothetical protein [Devosia marina]|uniref:Uncharacterized protein n=1 Tax=Devosia marina TaxID=2683198 RepID=A0A7X3FRH5_9HYPH|nr:hypothetical protein [Devosia marina]MVS99265.1 hypothetical protein [Devosia marina]
MRGAVILISFLMSSSAQAALNCSETTVYRQDVEGATGWNQILPVAPEDAAMADFSEFPFLDLTINGETTRYTTTSGGTGIRSRAAYIPDNENAKSFAYTMFDISERVTENQPGHFMILDGDLYWPECK